MIEVSTNLDQFKKGVFDVCKLFKTMFVDNRNVIIGSDNVNYINNLSRLVSELKMKNDSVYNFGVNFTLDQIKNFRENICINPILYIISLETLLNSITELKQLNRYRYSAITKELNSYYGSYSSLSKAKLTNKDIRKLFNKECDDPFLSKLVDELCNPSNVEIVESKTNELIRHSYYSLKARYVCGSLLGTEQKLLVVPILTRELYTNLVKLRIPIVVLCNEMTFEKPESYYISIYTITPTELMKNYNCLRMLTGLGELDRPENLTYKNFGTIKEFRFIESVFQFSSHITFKEEEVSYFKDRNLLDQYYSLQGKNLLVKCTEEYLEHVREIVTTIKSFERSGICYTECKTLRILIYIFEAKHKPTAKLLSSILKNYLQLFHFSNSVVEEVISNKDLKASFDVKSGKYDEDMFTSLDYYLNIFSLLASNAKVLKKLA